MKKRCFLVLCLCVILSVSGRTAESEKTQSEILTSRGWHVLRQLNAGPLLLGLTQRLGRVIESSQRDDVIWNGIEHGGSLKLNIAVEDDVTGAIFIGFFKDPHWSSGPVQVRSFPGPGDYIVENIPAGKYQIGAMIGSPPVANALGVQQAWPEPVEIERDKTNFVNILVSRDFQLRTSGWYNKTVSRDFIGDWEDMDTDNPLQGRVTGPGGQAIAFATVQIREYNPGARSIKAPNRGTNENGYYKCDGINWPYRVGVLRYKLLPSVLGYCYQYLFYNRVFEKCDTVDFQFENYPIGDATVKGHVLDDKGNPLKEFFVCVNTKMDWEARKNPDDKFYSMTGYRIPCFSEDGSYEVDDLPGGDVTIRVIPFNNQMYEMHRGQDIRLQAGKDTIMNLKVVSKNVLYGRVLFRDGSPAIVKPAPWPGATTSILFPMGMGRARGVAEVDDEGYFALYLSARELEILESGSARLIIDVPTSEDRRKKSAGDFPFEKLSADKSKAGIMKIRRPNIKPLVSVGKSLLDFEGIQIEFDVGQAQGRMILLCFFDMDQRPSRNCMMQLANRADWLKEKGITVIAIHAANVGRAKLDEWIRKNKMTFPVGMITEQEEQVRFDWGVKSLPWLILTDKQYLVTAEGFVMNELDNKIQSAQ